MYHYLDDTEEKGVRMGQYGSEESQSSYKFMTSEKWNLRTINGGAYRRAAYRMECEIAARAALSIQLRS
jgi:hypothetical protein